jgi:predicted ferric reductase
LDLIAKHKFLFIVLNVGILLMTPIEAHKLPVKYEVLVGLISFVLLNLVAFVGVRVRAISRGETI